MMEPIFKTNKRNTDKEKNLQSVRKVVLGSKKPLTVPEVAKATGLPPGTVNGVIRRLSHRTFVVARDGRYLLVATKAVAQKAGLRRERDKAQAPVQLDLVEKPTITNEDAFTKTVKMLASSLPPADLKKVLAVLVAQ